MKPIIVHSSEPITLFGGGDANPETIARALEVASLVVAADGGANLAIANNIVPSAIIGDFDSVSAKSLAAVSTDVHFKIEEQDSTDFDKALRSIEAPLVLCVGFTGGRLDHQLAALNTLVAHPDKCCIILGPRELVFVAPRRLTIDVPIGSPASLFPMGPVSGKSKGLKWPIDAIAFSPRDRIGTSNEVSGLLELEFECPNMLLILPIDTLEAVIAALLSQAGRWPSRGE